jgi:catalase
MQFQYPKFKVRELVKDKFDPILKEEYQEETAMKVFKASIEVIRQSGNRLTEQHYLPYSPEEKEDVIKEVIAQISEWKDRILNRRQKEEITRIDRVLSKKILDMLAEYLRVLEETDIAKRQKQLYYVDAVAAITELQESRKFASPKRKPIKRKVH